VQQKTYLWKYGRIGMLGAYLPILVLVVIAVCFGLGSVIFSSLIGPKKPSQVKLAPYECGCDPVGTARERFSIKFYLIAMLFILFDIEAVFLYPWAVLFKRLGMFGLMEMGVFIVILFVGYVYVWKKGALEWE
jgi:NADH-quinone oxidoreductase subunit A